MIRRLALVCMLVCVLGRGRGASAEATGDAQQAARTLFEDANRRFEHNDFVRAVALYRQALEHWDQPVIRFNLAVALIELDRSREAYDHLLAVVAHGTGALGSRESEARNYLRLLRARLATVTVRFAAGATAEIDGVAITRQAPVVLEPGSHTLVARQRGFEPYTRTLVLDPGKHVDVTVELHRPRSRLVRRWSPIGPWLVFGVGAASALGGGATLLLANREMDATTDAVGRACATGCADGLPAELAARAARAERNQRIGAITAIAGGAIVATGLLLIYLNQPRAEAAPPAVGIALDDTSTLVTWRAAF